LGRGKELLHLPHERESLADVGGNLLLFFRKITHGMVLQFNFNISQRDKGALRVRIVAAQFYHLGGESHICRFHIAVPGFVYPAEELGFRQ